MVAEKLGKSPAQVAIRWGLQMGHSLLPKSTNEERIKANFEVFDWSIPDDLFEEFTKIEQVVSFCRHIICTTRTDASVSYHKLFQSLISLGYLDNCRQGSLEEMPLSMRLSVQSRLSRNSGMASSRQWMGELREKVGSEECLRTYVICWTVLVLCLFSINKINKAMLSTIISLCLVKSPANEYPYSFKCCNGLSSSMLFTDDARFFSWSIQEVPSWARTIWLVPKDEQCNPKWIQKIQVK